MLLDGIHIKMEFKEYYMTDLKIFLSQENLSFLPSTTITPRKLAIGIQHLLRLPQLTQCFQKLQILFHCFISHANASLLQYNYTKSRNLIVYPHK